MRTGPLQVAHVVRDFSHGGMENGVANLVNHHDPSRVQGTIYVLAKADDFFVQRVHDARRVVLLNRCQGNDPSVIWHLAHRLRQAQPDVVHTHGWGTLVEGGMAAKLARVPVWVHGEHGTMETRRHNIWVQRIMWRLADQLLSVSENHRHALAHAIGAPVARIQAIPNGVALDRFGRQVDAAAWRQSFHIPADHVVIGSVGRLVEVKHYHHLITALAGLIHQRMPVSGVLIGDGPLRSALEEQAQSLGIAERVHFLGRREDVPSLLPLLDMFALTSRSEGMSNTILEAMASGLPVVATAVGGTPEMVIDGETGRLVPPRDPQALEAALAQLLADADQRRHMGRQARRRAETMFSLPVMIRAYEQLYEQLAGQRSRVRSGGRMRERAARVR
ncbi:MAG: hypothetical protein ETSY1_05550 [Candidatus Entotheonella factor]|uniref:Glycosyl transferase family 1 n=1 Tax=Entotheonella factor TaxID=1429438 RepID=W4LX18_ENTF1|nr:MAG: hypothetical protein ETSY1_05550 [Candidatus Entotheonella factor]